MKRTRRITLVFTILAMSLIVVAGCAGPTLQEEFTGHLEGQGIPVESVDVSASPHEAQVMMDLMILNSNGVDTSNIMDSQLIHATLTLENGEEVTAVKYKGDIYTYKQE